MPYRRFGSFAAVVLAAGMLLPVPILAQTTGIMRGLVTDEAGGPLPGVTIRVTNQRQGLGGLGAVSDRAGTFNLSGLPPALDYDVAASLQGFAGVIMHDVEVSAGRVSLVNIVLLPESSARVHVEVRARPGIVSLAETTTQTRVSSELLDALPILGRDYQDALTLAPGVTDVDGDGNPNIHGARDTDVITLVDGVSTSDPLTGKIGAQLNIESIQEIQVKTSAATAEFGRAQGGFADIVTKSGGNDLEGTFKIFWRSSTLDGDGAGIDDPSLHGGVGESGLRDLRFNDFLPFLSIGGPILKDRAWFYVANERIMRDDPVNALNAAFLRGVREWREFAKVTWQTSTSHRLALSLNYDPQDYLNEGLNSFTREESGYTLHMGGTMLSLKSTAILNPMVSLETTAAMFDQRPDIDPNLGPDTNHNGLLWTDLNANGMREAFEGDTGEDYDRDGRFDVFEDKNFSQDLNFGEDADGDGRLTPYDRFGSRGGGCEGILREDRNCNGRLDPGEDKNHNGILDPGEDLNGNLVLDPPEDRNGNDKLDDTPFPTSLYPYGELKPVPGDRGYTINRDTGVTSGPYYDTYSDRRQRFTLRQDLGVFVPDFKGSHDLRMGGVFEKESFSRGTKMLPILSRGLVQCDPQSCASPDGSSQVPPVPTITTLLPTALDVPGEATGVTAGLYIQDSYRPIPNLNIGFGLRFDREVDTTFGYTPFDPALEAEGFDRILTLGGFSSLTPSGVVADPIFRGGASLRDATLFITEPLREASLSRLTRHHSSASFDSDRLRNLGLLPPGSTNDPAQLLAQGIRIQTRENFAITNNNLAPRLSVSWDPSASGRSKVFATWGRYFDKLFLNTIVGEQGPDQVSRYYVYDADGVNTVFRPDNNIGVPISKAPPSITQVDRNLRTPFSDELTIGFEQELSPEVALSVTYIDRNYRQQLQDIDLNHFEKFDAHGVPVDLIGGFFRLGALKSDNLGSLYRVPDGRPDLYIHNIFFNQVLRVGNFNQARYRGIELALTRRLSRRWELQASYTYSRAQGDAEDFQSRLGNDPSTVEWESGYLDYDQRHVVKLNTAIFLPGDWQVGGALTWGSGLPYSIISRFFAFDDLDYQQFRTRYGYTLTLPGQNPRFVQLHRNSERNDPVLNVDLQARKQIVIGRRGASLSLEVFNLLNRDDLRILTYEPTPFSHAGAAAAPGQTPLGQLAINGERRFGRRFQVGLKIDF